LRKEFSVENHRSMNLEDAHGSLQSKYDELSKQMQELIANDKKLLLNFEQIQSRLTTPIPIELAAQVRSQLPEDAALNRLTVTERGTLQMLSQGALPASELGRRLNKSREHMARLMKKLYLEGYVDREPERPPFRYKLIDRLRSSLGDSVSALPSEKT